MTETNVVQVSAERYSEDAAEIRWHVTMDNRIWTVTTWEQRHPATGKASWSFVVPALGAEGTVMGFASCESALQAAIERIEQRQQGPLRRTFLKLMRPLTGGGTKPAADSESLDDTPPLPAVSTPGAIGADEQTAG
jgi:hypothetical protein